MNDGRVNIDLGLKSLRVRLSGRMVGMLAQTADGVLAFEYADEWLQDGHAEGDKGGGSWTLSPAYDLTRNAGMNGEHATLINGKGRDVTCDDVVAVGVRAGISKARAVALAREIEDAVRVSGVSRGRRF